MAEISLPPTRNFGNGKFVAFGVLLLALGAILFMALNQPTPTPLGNGEPPQLDPCSEAGATKIRQLNEDWKWFRANDKDNVALEITLKERTTAYFSATGRIVTDPSATLYFMQQLLLMVEACP